MAVAGKKKKKTRKTLLRQLSSIRTFEMGGVPSGSNRETDWLVCKEDVIVKLDPTKTNKALEHLQRVATVLKSGEPAVDAQVILHDQLADVMQLLASQGVSLDGIDREALKGNLGTIQTNVASISRREVDVALADEIDEVQESIRAMVEQLDGGMEAARRKKDAGKPQDPSEGAPANKPAGVPSGTPAVAPVIPAAPITPAPAAGKPAVTPAPVTGEAPKPPETPHPPAASQSPQSGTPAQEELVSKADLQGLLGGVTAQIKTLSDSMLGQVTQLNQKVGTIESGLATVNKQLDPGAIPALLGHPDGGRILAEEDDEDWPQDMNDLYTDGKGPSLGIG